MSVPVPRSVIGFSAVYLAISVGGALWLGNREFIFYLGVMMVLIPSLYAVHRRHPLGPALLWCFSIWGFLHMAGGLLPYPPGWFRNGDFPVLYSWWIIPDRLKYDQVIHAYGFGITTWMFWQILKSGFRDRDGNCLRPTRGVMILCVAASMGLGALNEVVEFAATRVVPDTNVGDYQNTGWDLVSNLVGALIAVWAIRRGARSAIVPVSLD